MIQQCKTCHRILVNQLGEYCNTFCRPFPRGEWRQALGTTWSGEGTTPIPKISGGKIPTGLSVAFYKALKKAGYMRDPLTGDYR